MMDSLGDHRTQSWILFNALVALLLILDLGIFNRKAHVIKLKEALGWSVFWITLGLGFGAWIYWYMSPSQGIEYVTGYLVEKSLSVDNLFVFLLIFRAFQIEKKYQHRLLFWGVLGAIILRAIMIGVGAELIERFHWLIQVFGAFLVWTGIKLFNEANQKFDPKSSPVLKYVRKLLPVTDEHHPGKFTITQNGKRYFTLSFVALILIESSDVLFALDSVPAVFGVSKDPFIVYTSNIFAILGLRSLFFVLEDFMDRFHLLKYGLAVILAVVGVKMLIEPWVKIPSWMGLAFICAILVSATALSFVIPPKKED